MHGYWWEETWFNSACSREIKEFKINRKDSPLLVMHLTADKVNMSLNVCRRLQLILDLDMLLLCLKMFSYLVLEDRKHRGGRDMSWYRGTFIACTKPRVSSQNETPVLLAQHCLVSPWLIPCHHTPSTEISNNIEQVLLGVDFQVPIAHLETSSLGYKKGHKKIIHFNIWETDFSPSLASQMFLRTLPEVIRSKEAGKAWTMLCVTTSTPPPKNIIS